MNSPTQGSPSGDIFDLPEPILKSVLATACGGPVANFTVRTERRGGVEGICGEYVVATFTVETASGTAQVPMFVRRQLQPSDRKRQAHHYEYLSKHGVAVPRLYGSHVDAQGREIIFLELLREIGAPDPVLLARRDYLEQFLRLAANLAAVPLTDAYVARLGYDLAGRDFVINWTNWLPWSAHILERIESRAPTGDLGPGVRDYCSRNSAAVARLRTMCLPLMRAVRSLPLGLVHGDLRPGNTGYRTSDRQLVLYDLEDISIDARFFDVGQVIGGPRPVLPGTHSNDELGAYFLSTYSVRSGCSVDLRSLLREARIVWTARKINLWELLPPSAGGAPYGQPAFVADPVERSERLMSTLSQLVESAGSLWEAISCPA